MPFVTDFSKVGRGRVFAQQLAPSLKSSSPYQYTQTYIFSDRSNCDEAAARRTFCVSYSQVRKVISKLPSRSYWRNHRAAGTKLRNGLATFRLQCQNNRFRRPDKLRKQVKPPSINIASINWNVDKCEATVQRPELPPVYLRFGGKVSP